MIIVSACLCGVNCRYDGKNNENETIKMLVKNGKAIPVCPEQLGGLSTPRRRCEIRDVEGNRRVIDADGYDKTDNFNIGAKETLFIAQLIDVKLAILKQASPSCGYGKIYDGTFSDNKVKGNGITAQLLEDNKIKVVTEDELENLEI